MRLIDADALVEAVKDYPYGYRGMIVCDIAKQPTIDPIRHGRWITENSIGGYCSNCGQYCGEIEFTRDLMLVPLWNYCPNCGAKMDGGKE